MMGTCLGVHGHIRNGSARPRDRRRLGEAREEVDRDDAPYSMVGGGRPVGSGSVSGAAMNFDSVNEDATDNALCGDEGLELDLCPVVDDDRFAAKVAGPWDRSHERTLPLADQTA
jgi:hypothetical protein